MKYFTIPILAAIVCLAAPPATAHSQQAPDPAWQERHDKLVARLRAVRDKAEAFGPAYTPLYRVILPWYEAWGGRNNTPVDDWAVSPEIYAGELADALDHGHNYIAEHLTSAFPAMFVRNLPNGQVDMENYQLHLPAGFPEAGRKYPLTIGLPGSGWIAHKISYSRGMENTDSWISVTPILEGRDWQIKFLNEYLDELIKILPVDPDRVYVSGHSLGAIATWNWALSNPERFAAISPDDGYSQPYRAVRLRNVPVWAVHGENDDVILPGLAEQMISAVRAAGGSALYSLLKGAPHNIPPWFNSQPVTEWYLRNIRSHKKPPPDPRDSLALNAGGFSAWTKIHLPAGMFWKSDPILSVRVDDRAARQAATPLFKKVDGRDTIVDGPVLYEIDGVNHTSVAWLSVPLQLQPSSKNDPTIVNLPARDMVRFWFAGAPDAAIAHLAEIKAKLKPSQTLSNKLWLTLLGPDKDNSRKQVYECWCEVTGG